ncbi:MAG: TIGR02300 family protein [Myxococcales bacterium]|jgi:uncharacterized protein (TIGR02300 family)
MAAKDLGTKYTCFKCGTRFYDLKRPEPICPKCGADQREAATLKPAEKTERRRAGRAPIDEVEIEQELIEEEEVLPEEDFGEEPEEDY